MAVSTSRRALVMVSAAAVSTAILAGCGSKSATTDTRAAPSTTALAASASPADVAGASASASATPSPGASATGSPSASASAGKAAKASPGPTASGAKPGPVAPPPPPVPEGPHAPPLQSSCKPSKPQPDEAKEAVGAALTAAAGQARTLTLSSGGTDKLPPLPVNLVKAIAWQESGWQSGILACYGGTGTMQVMPNTVSWMNTKFGTVSDAKTLAGNVQLGTQLLDWLVAYFGDSGFGGTYDLSPGPATGKTPLLDLVISAYNAGAGNVHYNTATDPAAGGTVGSLVIPNPGYVANVKPLMASQPWNKAG
ncbi:transglycosylase SLT domain-containing protein [Kitasatospora sp. NPDC059408]|uniref:transglycosylase SLT domain-containing protein n=1 Tax=Kitasatospora sp. NPDC059408 TaxID=3346823 RepID=UPI0036A6A655